MAIYISFIFIFICIQLNMADAFGAVRGPTTPLKTRLQHYAGQSVVLFFCVSVCAVCLTFLSVGLSV